NVLCLLGPCTDQRCNEVSLCAHYYSTPTYITELLPHYNPSRSLRSQNSRLLITPRITKSDQRG
ncbi:hypothetical protein IRJ41_011385, partial [Triplophysa rosa]